MSFITLLETSLYTTKEIIIAAIFLGGTLVFYGKNVILGILTTFLVSAGLFISYYYMGWNYKIMLQILLLCFAFMTIMIFLIKKQGESTGGVY